uniref:Large ribosomal subunit protein bL20c n=1 Tax=Trieres chinensis TaxID=1514140 RepID=A0A7S2ABF5_TRICV|mmetsp:Transcript_9581/g.20304  ORF Transcript_9581/g.20304 Transcript_9581/m.20304 type:complete len:227 (+) Transcript_9581:57-737(+)|eukprot:CAMPEP_0183291340 /NCGR_PEP_ID=MMETSP0160_2-20130417/798_1 /TAXON_ID=2839 ORGANISM="Odontella Sinensis, Strain Grunow 1884" /NCGR_SAMPLE_ID=MMETSP0160_2 /ASSEMBLY_ACC=CAM_ASM_000250 /LENGTH=226 /DNA_ID=CAMNT_0025452139 /DNA_START=55 /DNA_END=735 /DNA_ORIENTATION=+
MALASSFQRFAALTPAAARRQTLLKHSPFQGSSISSGNASKLPLFQKTGARVGLQNWGHNAGARWLSSAAFTAARVACSSFRQSPWKRMLKISEAPAPPLHVLHQQNQVRTIRVSYTARKKKKRIIKMAKGFRGRANRCYKIALPRVQKALQHAYRDRKLKKREFRRLWIQRINAGVRQHGLSYSEFIKRLHGSGITLNRKMLAELAGMEPFSFKAVVDVVKLRTA